MFIIAYLSAVPLRSDSSRMYDGKPTSSGICPRHTARSGTMNLLLQKRHCSISTDGARVPGDVKLDGAQGDVDGSARHVRVV